MDERFDREELRFDEQAQRDILDLAVRIKAEKLERASLADMEREGEKLGLSASDIRQAVAQYEGRVDVPATEDTAGDAEWGTFAVMAIHLILQTGMVYRWMHTYWPYESRSTFLLPMGLALVLGLLVRGSVLRYKRTVAYLAGSVAASVVTGTILHKVMGVGFSMWEVPKLAVGLLALEVLVVTVCSLKALSKEPAQTLRLLFKSPFRA